MIGKWIQRRNKKQPQNKPDHLEDISPEVMQSPSILCIAKALSGEDKTKHATYISEYLGMSGLPVKAIARAQMIGPYLLEVEDITGKIYIVCMNERYGLIGIKEDSLNGAWVFTVNY